VNPPPPPNDLTAALALGKGTTLHWYPQDVSPARLAATLAGMANTAGGTVILGISLQSGHIQGVSDPPALIDRVFQAALLVEPPLILPIPRVQSVGEVKVVWISVPPGLPQVYSLEGRYLGREGAQTNPLSATRLRRLLLERGVIQFESQCPPGATLADLDAEKISAYIRTLGLPGDDSPEEILLRRGCLSSAGGVFPSQSSERSLPTSPSLRQHSLHPTYAALLLFGRYPQQWLLNATILATRFSGLSFSDQYLKHEIAGTLPDQLRQAELFVRDHLRSVVRLVGLTHRETLEYPFEAVRELLVNAVAHRDYNQQGDTIHLNIFADRLEVSSPGRLPGPVTLDNLLEARFSRNAVIVQVLSDSGFIERLGYGLNRVVTQMRENGLRPPRFEEVGGSFRVTLFGSPPAETPLLDLSRYRTLGLNPRQEQAIVYLAAHRRISNSEYQLLCPDVHPETLRRDLADLVARGVLIKVGDKKATYYILK
jgi:ATP-dependent DNA helicase RecG